MPLSDPDLIPVFKPSLRVEALDGELLLILSERRRAMLRGRALALVGQAVDGVRSVAELVARLGAELAPAEVLEALDHLFSLGHLHAAGAAPTPADAYWELMAGAAPPAAPDACSVALACCGGIDPGPATRALALAGMRVDPGAGLRIALTDDYLRPELDAIAARARADQVPLLLVCAAGTRPTLGPLLHAQHGACLECLRFWLRVNRPVDTLLARAGGGGHLPLAFDAPGALAVFGLLANLVANLRVLGEERAGVSAAMLALDLGTLATARHAVLRRPQCPLCGDPALMRRQAERFPALQAVTGLLRHDGGYRQRDPVQTYEQYRHLVSPLTGPVAYLHPMPRRHGGMRKVYVAGYMVCPRDPPRAHSFDKVCAGKGQSEEQARASALCEALERYSGVYQGDEACVRASMRSLGPSACGFDALQLFSERQYAGRAARNALTDDRRRQVPQRFDPDTVIDWTPAWSLGSGRQCHVPLTYCYAEAPAAAGAAYGIHNPNGAAAGNCREEAILQGFLELVERDATAIWWYNRIPMPGVDLASFGDPYFERLVLDYAAGGWRLWVLDLTHDLGIPVCAALAHHPGQGRHAIGFGCHLDARLAVQRALTEVNQLFDPRGETPSPWDPALLGPAPFLEPAPALAPRGAAGMPCSGGADLRADIDACVALLAARGMDLLVVDKTRPDIGLPVVQVIVPGLRHFWPRFGPGRLYSVPLALGWLERASAEADLNPCSLFL
ncbi:TOMM precursor leader peptide-binding protein [Massilia sp. CCM 8733]|uniref:TOMM leader peptide-binding protein n=1 Tax=Massilia mucilaginosa TaxID=2609282 RepID=A0ABX0NSY5_9BURK|nr:TOMM precursor leader peptide-binding protein [Massilia mucilaginosa]NHZ89911.1 TOMM precursor leader peptide-binding protein [Massilia mucilaginosa]